MSRRRTYGLNSLSSIGMIAFLEASYTENDGRLCIYDTETSTIYKSNSYDGFSLGTLSYFPLITFNKSTRDVLAYSSAGSFRLFYSYSHQFGVSGEFPTGFDIISNFNTYYSRRRSIMILNGVMYNDAVPDGIFFLINGDKLFRVSISNNEFHTYKLTNDLKIDKLITKSVNWYNNPNISSNYILTELGDGKFLTCISDMNFYEFDIYSESDTKLFTLPNDLSINSSYRRILPISY